MAVVTKNWVETTRFAPRLVELQNKKNKDGFLEGLRLGVGGEVKISVMFVIIIIRASDCDMILWVVKTNGCPVATGEQELGWDI